MADPQVTAVLANAAFLLGDTAQEQFTNNLLATPFGMAFRELFDVFQRWRLPIGKREAYALLPANTNVIAPSQFGITDFGEPVTLWERSGGAAIAITGVSNATPMEVTTGSAHGLNSGALAEIYGVVGPIGVNGQWYITVTSPTKFTLNGSLAGGVYSAGGYVTSGTNAFTPLQVVDYLPQTAATGTLGFYKWENAKFYFIGSYEARELWVTYTTSGAAPTSGNVGIDDSQNFLALRTASIIAPSYDMPQTAERCLLEAFGPSQTADGTGGALRGLVGPALLQKQAYTKRPGTFRPRRNAITRTIW